MQEISSNHAAGDRVHTQQKQPVPRDAIEADFMERKFWKSLRIRRSPAVLKIFIADIYFPEIKEDANFLTFLFSLNIFSDFLRIYRLRIYSQKINSSEQSGSILEFICRARHFYLFSQKRAKISVFGVRGL